MKNVKKVVFGVALWLTCLCLLPIHDVANVIYPVGASLSGGLRRGSEGKHTQRRLIIGMKPEEQAEYLQYIPPFLAQYFVSDARPNGPINDRYFPQPNPRHPQMDPSMWYPENIPYLPEILQKFEHSTQRPYHGQNSSGVPYYGKHPPHKPYYGKHSPHKPYYGEHSPHKPYHGEHSPQKYDERKPPRGPLRGENPPRGQYQGANTSDKP